jgi:heme exporter protein A
MVSSRGTVPTTTLEAENLAKAFSGPPLFSGLSFRVSEGFVAVSGRNGSGKTTLLKILAGLMRASQGRVRIEREPGGPLSGADRRLAVGWSGPDLAFYGELTALENLEFFRKAAGHGVGRPELLRRLDEAGLGREAVDRRVEEYSTGMKQRLRIAFARLFDPPLLILDEPMVYRTVEEARKAGAVLLASNDERDFVRPDQRIELAPARSAT